MQGLKIMWNGSKKMWAKKSLCYTMYFLLLFLLITFCGQAQNQDFSQGQILLNSQEPQSLIHVEKAITPQQHALGLMNRKELSDNRGMLFIFDKSDFLSFWMKNTFVALDIIFLDDDLKVCDIFENTTPLSETPMTSQCLSRTVVEVKSGMAKKWRVSKGTPMKIVK